MSRERKAVGKATGRDIILTIGKTMQDAMEPLLTRTLAPSLYQVYLHPTDYDRLRTVFHKVEVDARQYLDRELARLNREAQPPVRPSLGRLRKALGQSESADPVMKFESTDGAWYIQFQEDPNGELEAGDVEVVAELAVGEEARYGSGNKTHRITSTTRRLGRMETRQEVRETSGFRSSGSARLVEPEAPIERQPLAWFRFVDDGGSHDFAMEREEIVIGRRAEDVWVDLDLDTAEDVSREHARVRYRGGRFWIKDLSTYGTTVNAVPVRPSLRVEDGREHDVDHWEELPDGAQVELASVVTLTFRVAQR